MRALIPAVVFAAVLSKASAAEFPVNNPVADLYEKPADAPRWVEDLPWTRVLSIEEMPGADWDARVAAGQHILGKRGGGVLYFPPGVYEFGNTLRLQSGIILRGATPQGQTDARKPDYAPPTVFVFPAYVPVFRGEGAAPSSAFKGIELQDARTDSHCGVVNIDLRHAHITFGTPEQFGRRYMAQDCGRGYLVHGCVLTNAAVLDTLGNLPRRWQHAWQRWTHRHHGAVEVWAQGDVLLSNNRLPESDANFVQPGYIVADGKANPPDDAEPGSFPTRELDILFDYDNRPGLSVNFVRAVPELAVWDTWKDFKEPGPDSKIDDLPRPYALARGIEIRNNYVYCTGCTAIRSSGDGTAITGNVVRFKEGVKRPTYNGYNLNSFTNNNRAVEIRGWRWTIAHNDYEVHSNLNIKGHRYGDGEGLMHEAFNNCDIRGSRMIGNRGNSYLCFWRVPADGLLIQDNTVHRRGLGHSRTIHVLGQTNKRANGRKIRHPLPLRNVRVLDNETKNGPIAVIGTADDDCLIAGNRAADDEPGKIINDAEMPMGKNTNYTVVD